MSFSVINNLRTLSYELQINFGVLQTDTENSATGINKTDTGEFELFHTFMKM